MMIRKKIQSVGTSQVLVCTPLATVAVTVFARPEVSQPLEKISNVKVSDLSDAMKTYTDKNQQNNQSAPDTKNTSEHESRRRNRTASTTSYSSHHQYIQWYTYRR